MDESSSDAPINAADALRRIVEQVPIESWQEPGMLRGRLADRGVPPSEANLLVNALQEGVPQRIRREREDTPREVLLGIVKSRLIDGQGMAPERAEWAARAWIDALVPQKPAGRGEPDEFVWTDGPTGPVGPTGPAVSRVPTGAPAVTPAPPRPSPVSMLKPQYLIVVVVLAAMFVIAKWLDSRNATAEVEYRITHVVVFPSRVETVALDELVNFASSCQVGAPFPSERCAILLPMPETTPFVGVDQEVLYTPVPGRGLATVDVSCTLTDQVGQASAPVTSRGELPDPVFTSSEPRPARWRTMFPRPASGWMTGRYKVTCVSPQHTVDGWFEVTAR